MSKKEITKLSEKKEVIMNHFWDKGELFVRELRELYPEPKPHFNTLSTQVRELESDGFLDHKAYGPTYQYFPIVTRDEYSRFSMGGFIGNYFGSYLNAVSAFVGDGKVSIDELKELIEHLEKN
ncbi:MAG: BlaI/MecI/CopY family transcriptional regulator [Bacteroidaceae bacterium]|nr:BlaI/MecI/CopY family transcriptional regulator [Bacteroidaceae bacterium]